jgi:tetratricopeptide (TPR) repeat protein
LWADGKRSLEFDGLFNAHTGRSFVFRVVRSGSHVVEDVSVSIGAIGSIDAPETDALTHFLKAKSDLGRHPDTDIREYSMAIELAPDFDLAYVGRAQVYRNNGRVESAIADYRKASELDPHLPEALRGLVELITLPRQHAPDEALRLIESAVASDRCGVQIRDRNSDCAQDLADLSFVLLRNGDGRGAIEEASNAIGYDPRLASAYADLAWGYYAVGDVDRARENLEHYRSFSQSSPQQIHELQTAVATAPRP